MSCPPSQIFIAAKEAPALKLTISPLAGEMSGRTEGGVKERSLSIPAVIELHPIICSN